MRTTFVNPRYRGKKRGKRSRRRNAGITSFTKNPLILSNPAPKRRRRRSNPTGMPNVQKAVNNGLSYAGGAALALGANTYGLSKIDNAWGRRGAQFLASVAGGSMLGKKSANMGAAFAGAMMYPLLQDVAADLLGIGVGAGSAAVEADMDMLSADLEDVLDDMSEDDLQALADEDEEEVW